MRTEVDTFVITKAKRGTKPKRNQTFSLVHSGAIQLPYTCIPMLSHRNRVMCKGHGVRGMGWMWDIARSGYRDKDGKWVALLYSSLN